LQEKSVGKALSSSEIDSFENKILVKRNTLGVKIGAKSNMGVMTSPMSERYRLLYILKLNVKIIII
jgi:hypothetical protein